MAVIRHQRDRIHETFLIDFRELAPAYRHTAAIAPVAPHEDAGHRAFSAAGQSYEGCKGTHREVHGDILQNIMRCILHLIFVL